MKARTKKQRGLSLIELMISMTLGLILLAGLIQIMVGTKRGFRIQESAGRLQENARFALDLLAKDIRLADFWGGVEAGDIATSAVSLTGAGSCDSAWLQNTAFGLQGFENHATTPQLPASCLNAADYEKNTDILAIRSLDPNGFRGDADAFTAGWPYLQVDVGRRAAFFLSTGTSPYGRPWAVGPGLMTYRYDTAVFFVRPCANKVAATCTAAADNGNPVPSLVAWTVNGAAMEQRVLVNGVEQLQFEYGVDTDSDKVVNRWRRATDLGATAANWAQVIAVRIGVVVRGDALDEFNDTTTYAMPSGYSYAPAAGVRKYQRRLFVRDIQIRNRIRS